MNVFENQKRILTYLCVSDAKFKIFLENLNTQKINNITDEQKKLISNSSDDRDKYSVIHRCNGLNDIQYKKKYFFELPTCKLGIAKTENPQNTDTKPIQTASHTFVDFSKHWIESLNGNPMKIYMESSQKDLKMKVLIFLLWRIPEFDQRNSFFDTLINAKFGVQDNVEVIMKILEDNCNFELQTIELLRNDVNPIISYSKNLQDLSMTIGNSNVGTIDDRQDQNKDQHSHQHHFTTEGESAKTTSSNNSDGNKGQTNLQDQYSTKSDSANLSSDAKEDKNEGKSQQQKFKSIIAERYSREQDRINNYSDMLINLKRRLDIIIFEKNSLLDKNVENLFFAMPDLLFYIEWSIEMYNRTKVQRLFSDEEKELIIVVLMYYETKEVINPIPDIKNTIIRLRSIIQNKSKPLENLSEHYRPLYDLAIKFVSDNDNNLEIDDKMTKFMAFMLPFLLESKNVNDFIDKNKKTIDQEQNSYYSYYNNFWDKNIELKENCFSIVLCLNLVLDYLKSKKSSKENMDTLIIYPFKDRHLMFTKCGVCGRLILTCISPKDMIKAFYNEICKIMASN